jgi:aspartyl/glutamyl-tRNA(Asn/Gln) amidotransferase C subunit
MAAPKISVEDVKKIAQLAKMNVSGQEEKFAELFTDTLTKIQDLNQVDTSGVTETFQVTGLENIFQDNLKGNTLSKDETLSNSKNVINGLFTTKGVFIKEEDVS